MVDPANRSYWSPAAAVLSNTGLVRVLFKEPSALRVPVSLPAQALRVLWLVLLFCLLFGLLLVLVGCTSAPSSESAPPPSSKFEASTTLAAIDSTELGDEELTFDSLAVPISSEITLVKPGKLSACMDSPFPPFQYSKQSDGEDLSGIDVDIVTALAASSKLEAVFVEVPFDQAFNAVRDGRCDIIASAVPINNEIGRSMQFSTPYFAVQQSLLVQADKARAYRSLADLRAKTIGVQVASVAGERLRGEASSNGVRVRDFEGRLELLAALRAGEIDAVVADSPVNGFDAKESDGEFVLSALLPGIGDKYALVAPKSNPLLTEQLNRSLQRLRDRGLLRKIIVRYVGTIAAG